MDIISCDFFDSDGFNFSSARGTVRCCMRSKCIYPSACRDFRESWFIMGAWSSNLYGNDTTLDVRDTYMGFLEDQVSMSISKRALDNAVAVGILLAVNRQTTVDAFP